MGDGDHELGLRLLRKYLNSDLEQDECAERYVFYNGGVKAASARCRSEVALEASRGTWGDDYFLWNLP